MCDVGLNADRPWLAVVMPIHNGAMYLRETLCSLAAEADERVEIIIIDSSDDDQCRRIVSDFGILNIDYSFCPDLKPWPAKTNQAVSRARAPYITMLHQDDLWLPGRLKIVRDAFKAVPEAAVCITPSTIVDMRGQHLGTWRCPLKKKARVSVWSGEPLLIRLLTQNFISIAAPVIRRVDWLAVNGLDEALWYTADWDLYLKLAQRGSIIYADVPTVSFRVHPQSLTITGARSIIEFQRQMRMVVDRHNGAVSAGRQRHARQLAEVSVAVNVALASAISRNFRPVWPAMKRLLRLSPRMLAKYLMYSRIVERAVPRIRARLSGAL